MFILWDTALTLMVDASAITLDLHCKLFSSLIMNSQHNLHTFPLWAYLKQPIFSSRYKLKLNPRKFWHSQRLSHLEQCWMRVYKPEEHYNSWYLLRLKASDTLAFFITGCLEGNLENSKYGDQKIIRIITRSLARNNYFWIVFLWILEKMTLTLKEMSGWSVLSTTRCNRS